MIKDLISSYPKAKPYKKTKSYKKKSRRAAAILLIIPASILLYYAAQSIWPSYEYGGWVLLGWFGPMIAYCIICPGKSAEIKYNERVYHYVMTETIAKYDNGSGWNFFSLDWKGARCAISNKLLYLYLFESDEIITIPLCNVFKYNLGQKQIGSISNYLGATVYGVNSGQIQTQHIVSWVLDLYLRNEHISYLPLNFGGNESYAKQFYSLLMQRV